MVYFSSKISEALVSK